MSAKLGAINYDSGSDEIFIGRSMAQARPYSEEVAGAIDREVKAIVDAAYDRCNQILSEFRPQLEVTAQYLLDHETMDGNLFHRVFTCPEDPELVGYPGKTE